MNLETTMFISNQDRAYEQWHKCHDGEGPLKVMDLIAARGKKQFIKFIHDDVIPPGSTIGDHPHRGEAPFEEWYLVLSGEGIMQLDGKEYVMKPGDISGCFANGHHGIRNTGKEDLRLIVICASAIQP